MDTGDTAWLLMSTALVMIMLPGLALFYGGLVRRKNVLSTIMHSFFGLALVSVVWVIVGFSIAFGPDVTLPIIGSGWIGGFLVILGTFLLVRTYLPQIDFDWFWPLVLVAIGAFLIVSAVRRQNPPG